MSPSPSLLPFANQGFDFAFQRRPIEAFLRRCILGPVTFSLLVACTASLPPAGYSQKTLSPEELSKQGLTEHGRIGASNQQAEASGIAPKMKNVTQTRRLYAEVPEGGRLIGSEGGIALEALGPSGHWVAYCQTKSLKNQAQRMPTDARGAPLKEVDVFLQVGHTKRSIEALLTYDKSGRYLVTLEKGTAWLNDALKGDRWNLSAMNPDLRPDGLPDHRSFSFAGRGLVFLSDPGSNAGYYLPLPQGTAPPLSALLSYARPLSFGVRPVWRLQGYLGSISASTIAPGTLSKAWPVPQLTKSTHRCRAPFASYDAFSRASAYRPDPSLASVWLALPRVPGELSALSKIDKKTPLEAQPAPGFVMGTGDSWVRRQDSGRLLLVKKGTQKQIASSRCGGRILHLDKKTGLFLIACEGYTPIRPPRRKKGPPKYRFGLNLVKPGFVRDLRADVARTGVDVEGHADTRLFPLRPGASAALVDFKNSRLIHLKGSVHVLSTTRSHALLRRDKGFALWSTKGEVKVDLQADALAPILSNGSAVAVGSTLLLLEEKLRSWKLPGAPLALSPQGYALIPKHAGTLQSWPDGPFLLLGPPPSPH